MVLSPDDQELLLVFGSHDVCEVDYAQDELNRFIRKVDLMKHESRDLTLLHYDAHQPTLFPDKERSESLPIRYPTR